MEKSATPQSMETDIHIGIIKPCEDANRGYVSESDVSVKILKNEGSQMPQLFNLRAPVFLQEPTPAQSTFFSAFIFMHRQLLFDNPRIVVSAELT